MRKLLTGILLLLTFTLSAQFRSVGVVASSHPTKPTVLSDGNTVGWYIFDELTTITKVNNDSITKWADFLGSGHDLNMVPNDGTNETTPAWTSSGISFNGVRDMLRTATFTWNRPEMVYMVVEAVVWGDNKIIFDGFTSASAEFYQRLATPSVYLYAGTRVAQNNNMPLGSFCIARVKFNGASSSIQINATTATTGDPGAVNMAGLTLGTIGSHDINYCSQIIVKEMICRKIIDASGDETIVYNYLKAKYGL